MVLARRMISSTEYASPRAAGSSPAAVSRRAHCRGEAPAGSARARLLGARFRRWAKHAEVSHLAPPGSARPDPHHRRPHAGLRPEDARPQTPQHLHRRQPLDQNARWAVVRRVGRGDQTVGHLLLDREDEPLRGRVGPDQFGNQRRGRLVRQVGHQFHGTAEFAPVPLDRLQDGVGDAVLVGQDVGDQQVETSGVGQTVAGDGRQT